MSKDLAYPDAAHSSGAFAAGTGYCPGSLYFILRDRGIELKARDRDPVDLEAAYKAEIGIETHLKHNEAEHES